MASSSARRGAPASRSDPPPRAALLLALFLVAGVTLIVQAPVLEVQAVSFDDDEFLTRNPLVQSPGWSSARRFTTEVLEPSTVKGYYAPLTMISLMLDHAMGGRADDLRVFHRTNLTLHVLNTLGLVLLIYALLGSLVPAALAGLLFGVHPLTVEPLAWIAERKTLLATFWSVGALFAWVRFAKGELPRGRALALAAFVLACLSKPTAVVLPALMLCLDSWPMRRLGRAALVEKLPFFAVAGVFATITLVSHRSTVGLEVGGGGLFERILTAAHLVAFYLGKLLWPTDLTSVYLLPDPVSLANPTVAIGVAAVFALGLALLWLARSGTTAPLACALFFVSGLAPTLGGLRFSWVQASDKYVYLPGMGAALLLGWGAAWLWDRPEPRRRVARVGLSVSLALVAAALATTSRAQLVHWRSTETLYRYMLVHTPMFPLLHLNLGETLMQSGRIEEAARHFYRALESEPEYAKAHNNLGVLFWSTRQPERALDHLQRAVASEPELPKPHTNLGIAYNGLGRPEDARREFAKALAIDAEDPQTHCGLALALSRLGRKPEARRHYDASLAIAPGCRLPPGALD